MLADSNILIYVVDPDDTVCKDFLKGKHIRISTITRIEVLGYPGFKSLSNERQEEMHKILSFVAEIPLSEEIVLRAIELRQQRRMSVADAVVAATALVHKLDLATRNTADFKHIDTLRLVNPYDQHI